jgi:hypothetical protein
MQRYYHYSENLKSNGSQHRFAPQSVPDSRTNCHPGVRTRDSSNADSFLGVGSFGGLAGNVNQDTGVMSCRRAMNEAKGPDLAMT